LDASGCISDSDLSPWGALTAREVMGSERASLEERHSVFRSGSLRGASAADNVFAASASWSVSSGRSSSILSRGGSEIAPPVFQRRAPTAARNAPAAIAVNPIPISSAASAAVALPPLVAPATLPQSTSKPQHPSSNMPSIPLTMRSLVPALAPAASHPALFRSVDSLQTAAAASAVQHVITTHHAMQPPQHSHQVTIAPQADHSPGESIDTAVLQRILRDASAADLLPRFIDDCIDDGDLGALAATKPAKLMAKYGLRESQVAVFISGCQQASR
jgi:hypothetical protein